MEPVDGVLAFDQQALGILLAAIGPVEVPGHEVRVTTANAYTVLEHFAHSTATAAPGSARRPFYADLTAALLDSITERLRSDPGTVLGAVQAMVAEKHLLAAFEEPTLQRLVEQVGAGGRLPATTNDLIYIVDAQVDHGAPFRSIEQSIQYRADPDYRARNAVDRLCQQEFACERRQAPGGLPSRICPGGRPTYVDHGTDRSATRTPG